MVEREITEDLTLACAGLSDVELFEYEMSVSLKKVTPRRFLLEQVRPKSGEPRYGRSSTAGRFRIC